MEEKLRNLSQNIAANTGDDHKPIIHHPEEESFDEPKPEEEYEHHEDEKDEQLDHQEEENFDNSPEENSEEPREEHDEQELDESSDESSDDVSDYTPEQEEHFDEPQENVPEDGEGDDSSEEEYHEEPKEETTEKEPSEAEEEPRILSMEEDGSHESPAEPKKYSPEVEAALNRLKADDVSVDFNTEPLSTEPKKVHHGGRIFLIFLFIIALAAVVLCVLVEQKVIENPLDLFSGKQTTPTSEVAEVDEKETELTDSALIKSIDSLFATIHEGDNYYIYNRSYQKSSDVEYIYYDVAEPAAKVESPNLNGELTNDGTAETTTSSQTNCDHSSTETDNCIDVTASDTVTASNYKKFPHYRYIFAKNTYNAYEFREKHLLETPENN